MKITDFKLEKYKEILDRPLGDANNPSGKSGGSTSPLPSVART